MARAYTASDVKHALPSSPGAYRERRVTFEDEQCVNDSFDEKSAVSQEEADLRLAIALQKQENAVAYRVQRKRRDDAVGAMSRRTGRSCAHGFGLSVRDVSPDQSEPEVVTPPIHPRPSGVFPKMSATPDSSIDMDDHPIISSASGSGSSTVVANDDPNVPAWVKLRQVEKSAAGTAAATQKILEEDVLDHTSQRRRSGMSASAPLFGGGFARAS